MPTIQLPDYLQTDADANSSSFTLFEYDLRAGRLSNDDIIDFINRNFINDMANLYEELAGRDVYEENKLKEHRNELADKDIKIAKLEKELKIARAEVRELQAEIRRLS